jgi:enoyl-CoA hydratase
MSSHGIRVEWSETTAVVTLNRPSKRNAVDLQTLVELQAAQVEAGLRNIRALVLTGEPPAFCAGADLVGVREEDFHSQLNVVLRGFTQLSCVTIAAIDGPALGAGAQLAAVCDLRVATPDSIVGIPAAKLGLVVNHWTIERFTREMSWPVARAMLLAAKTYTAQELVSIGSIHRLGLLSDAVEWAKEIAQLAPLTIAGHKIALEASAGEPEFNELVALARERAATSEDVQEGREAFLQKRKPRFAGN